MPAVSSRSGYGAMYINWNNASLATNRKNSEDGKSASLWKASWKILPSLQSTSGSIIPYKPYFKKEEDQNLTTELKIYTDGSKIDDEAGYAYCDFEKHEGIATQQVHLSQHNSIYQAELLAIKYAISLTEISYYNFLRST